MSHNCFISFKKEDDSYKETILTKLGSERILGRALDEWIDSPDIDYVMQVIRTKYMAGTTVTIFLIGEHSSEKEGNDILENFKQHSMIGKNFRAVDFLELCYLLWNLKYIKASLYAKHVVKLIIM